MDMFSEPLFYRMGIGILQIILNLVGITAGQTPEMFSASAWDYVTGSLYPWFAAIGASLLKTFWLVGFIRQSTNIRQEVTMEALVEGGIKLVLADMLMAAGVKLMQICFAMSGKLSLTILTTNGIPTFEQADMDVGARMFYGVFGIIFFAICIVSAGTIFLTVYGRYLNLYMLVLAMPIAVSTIPGGHGVSHTASSWVRTFFGQVFSIVFIMVAVVVASRMCDAIDFGQMSGILGYVDGMMQAVQNCFTIVLLTAAVKGADIFMRRTFGL